MHALQDRVGQITQPGLNYACGRLSVPPAEAYGVATFYALFTTKPRPPVVAHVCDDIACRLAGAEELCGDLERTLGVPGEPARDGRIAWLRSPCLGLCELAPAAMFTIAGEAPVRETAAPVDAAGIVRRLERAAGPSTNGHANARVILDVGEGGTQLFHGGHVKCVEDLGTINRDVSDGVLFFEENVFGVHKFKF